MLSSRFAFIFLVAGMAFFSLGLIGQVIGPFLMVGRLPVKTIDELAQTPLVEFNDLEARYPENFRRYFGEADSQSLAEALRLGRDVYVAEACWQCHSQYVRPVSKEEIRFGRVSTPSEYQNLLQRPPLFGTRRVGPDLIRAAGKHSNDWHAAHLFNPRYVSPTSIMPRYPWFFDDNSQPNKRGLAIITYVQWLGSWLPEAQL